MVGFLLLVNLPSEKSNLSLRGRCQKKVAGLLGHKDKTWISHSEHGDALPNMVSANRLAKAYNTSIEDLFPVLSEYLSFSAAHHIRI
jgi:DNA-binding XRE family transcriptional regulator